MKIGSNLLFAALFPAFSSAAVFMEIIDEHPDHLGQCFVNGAAHPLEASWDASSAAASTCQRKSCTSYDSGNQLLVITSTCPSVAAESPCYIVEDKSASYPDCCPRYECPTIETVIDDASENILNDDENKVHADDVLDALLNSNDVITNEIQDSGNDDDVIDNIMMESRITEPVRVMLPPPEIILEYDVTMTDDVTDGGDDYNSDIFVSPFRWSIPSEKSGKPIVQFRR